MFGLPYWVHVFLSWNSRSPLAYIPPREIMLLAEEETKKRFDEIKAASNKNEIHFRTEFIVATRSVVSPILVMLKNKISICSGVIYLFEMRYIA
jgi:hypothetical protein